MRYRTYATVALIGDIIPTMILVGVGSSVMESGVLETGANGAQSIEALAPTIGLLLGVGIAAVVMVGLAFVLRPRLARMLARQSAASAPSEATAPRPRQRRLTLGLSRGKRGVRGAA